MPFPPEVKAEAPIACGRLCCICHKFCGVRIECHHIVPESKGGLDTLENCIPLCFDCHAEVEHYNAGHPKGNKFSPEELRGHRDDLRRMRREALTNQRPEKPPGSLLHPSGASKKKKKPKPQQKVTVLVHRARLVSSSTALYFVNVTNGSTEHDVVITHVWFEYTHQIQILNNQRPLPIRLKPGSSWETWIEAALIPADASDHFQGFRARLANGTLILSRANRNVPSGGFVPSGQA